MPNNGTTITEQEVKDRLSVMEGETANTVIAHTADINGDGYVTVSYTHLLWKLQDLVK